MRYFLLFILILFAFDAYPQRKVSGVITETDGTLLPGVIIQESGTTNRTVSDVNGMFHITTLIDICSLNFSFLGFKQKTIKITQDIIVNIVLEVDCVGGCASPGWISTGLQYDITNSTFGMVFSNGYDERPLIHFEEFPDDLTYKINAQSNFHKDYSFGASLAYPFHRLRIASSIGYEQYCYLSKDFFHRDVHLSATTYMKLIDTSLILKTGYQALNNANNWGVCIGLRKGLIYSKLYSGISVGYYFDYLSYSIYFQGLIINKNISYRLTYDKIDNYNFLNIGLNLLFNR